MVNKQKNSGKLVQKFIAVSLIIQAIVIGVKGNIDVLLGNNPIDVIQLMLAQGVELIIKAYNAEKRIGKKIDRTNKPGE
ncbi:hypothetical protein NIES2119_06685 [[Phormidium ambiguum] IAM M-71]|uniref:Holin n=1 Tax=[Phormidium ambiguum] IAM M-71 TaxID=454136 RepID=A0A1U7IPU9_9CYAN|nr:hypothetical protein [Phormidium ambiguum]OKH39419.1 hypothetical protein NIES2119_06685 [Phormidium ambiguum IAM M-71]